MPNNRKRYIVDARGKILGRMATKIANILYGKLKVDWAPNVDNGDYVTVINAVEVVVTGKKMEQKIYYRHSGYPGGIKSLTLREMLEKKPEQVIIHAVKGMLPKNKLGKSALKRLIIFVDDSAENKDKLIELEV